MRRPLGITPDKAVNSYYDSDANLDLLKDKTILFLGYVNSAHTPMAIQAI